MGKALADAFPAAKAVFDEVDSALSQKLSALMWEGPEADLTLTANAQPALMAVSMAVIAVLKAEHGITVANTAKFVGGHSLGEYSALAAAGNFFAERHGTALAHSWQCNAIGNASGRGRHGCNSGIGFCRRGSRCQRGGPRRRLPGGQ